jgi:hypothetical protein
MITLEETEIEYNVIRKKVSNLHSLFNSKLNNLEAPHRNLVLIQIKALETYEAILAQTLIILRANNN